MEATCVLGKDVEFHHILDAYLCKNLETPSLDLCYLEKQNQRQRFLRNYMEKQTFHIPSFGDDEFDFQSTFPQHDDSQHSTFTQQPDDSSIPLIHTISTQQVTRTSNHQNIFTTFTRNSGIGNDLNNRLVDNSTSLNNGLINNSNSLNNNRLSHPPPSDSFRHSQQVAPSVPRLSHPPVSQSDYSLNSALNSLDNLNPLFPPQNINIPDISVSNSVDQLHSGNSLHTSFNQEFIDRDIYNAYSSVTSQGRSPYPTHNPSRVQHSNHPLSLQLTIESTNHGAGGIPMNSSLTPSPLGSNSDSDDMPLAQLAGAKRGAPKGGKKGGKAAKKRKKKDPNEPQKPVSAYALFFRDTQAAIKGSNPNANFGEISKIVASMWDSLDPEQKGAYKKRTEVAKKDYLKQLAAYRASLVSKQGVIEEHPAETNSPVKPVPMVSILPSPVKMDAMSNPTQTMTHPIQKGMAMEREPILMSMPQPDSYQNNTDVSQGAYQAQAPPTQQLTQIAPKPLPQLTDNVSHMQDTELQDQLAQLDNFSLQHCMRNGCGNQAVEQIGWDQEYCSNDCVVSHCRDVFTAWISARGTSYASVK